MPSQQFRFRSFNHEVIQTLALPTSNYHHLDLQGPYLEEGENMLNNVISAFDIWLAP